MQCELVGTCFLLRGRYVYIRPTVYIIDRYRINSASALEYWSKERAAGVDALLLIIEDENEACRWLVGH
jgi:hypothetical protein